MDYSLTYRKKNKLLIGAIGLLIALIYLVPVRATLKAYSTYVSLSATMANAKDAPVLISQAEQLHLRYKNILPDLKIDSLKQEEFIINKVSRACYQFDVSIVSFAPPEKYVKNNYILSNQMVKVKGTYKQILLLIRSIERQNSVGKLINVNFVLEEDQWRKKMNLFAYLYLQNIQNVGNED